MASLCPVGNGPSGSIMPVSELVSQSVSQSVSPSFLELFSTLVLRIKLRVIFLLCLSFLAPRTSVLMSVWLILNLWILASYIFPQHFLYSLWCLVCSRILFPDVLCCWLAQVVSCSDSFLRPFFLFFPSGQKLYFRFKTKNNSRSLMDENGFKILSSNWNWW